MNERTQKPSVLILMSLTALMIIAPYSSPARAISPGPFVGVWSSTYSSSVVWDTSKTPGTSITVDLNVTNAPAFNGYDLTLFYDPAYLNAVSIDVQTGTVFNNPFIAKNDLSSDGTIRLAVVNVGSAFSTRTGVLAHITFNVTGIGVSPIVLAAPTTNPSFWAQSWTELVLGASAIDIRTADGYFRNVPEDSGPVATFTVSPPSPQEGDAIVFDASGSLDRDNNHDINKGVAEYIWEFSDGTSDRTIYPVVLHQFTQILGFNLYGNFSVRLTVTDSDQHFEGMRTERVQVGTIMPSTKNFAISTNTIPRNISPGSSMTYQIGLLSLGGFSGPVGLSATIVPLVQNGPTPSMPAKVNLHLVSASTVLAVNTSASTPPGRYSIVVLASRAQLYHLAIVFLTVD